MDGLLDVTNEDDTWLIESIEETFLEASLEREILFLLGLYTIEDVILRMRDIACVETMFSKPFTEAVEFCRDSLCGSWSGVMPKQTEKL